MRQNETQDNDARYAETACSNADARHPPLPGSCQPAGGHEHQKVGNCFVCFHFSDSVLISNDIGISQKMVMLTPMETMINRFSTVPTVSTKIGA